MKNLKEVDWGKAPEGATHYNEDCMWPWFKETPASYFVEDKGVWVEYGPDNSYYKHRFNGVVKRPQEWDGSGVPPVGTVCEYRLNDGAWFTCKIVYMLSGTDDSFVAYCDHLGIDQFLALTSDRYKLQLRKIKTPEQIAAEERLAAIDEMMGVGNWQSRAFKEVVSALYDAGYRKAEDSK